MIALADTMDAAATVQVDPDRHRFETPDVSGLGLGDFDPHIRLQDSPLDQEARLADKLRLARAFASANNALIRRQRSGVMGTRFIRI